MKHTPYALVIVGALLAVATIAAPAAEAVQIRLQPGQQRSITLTVPRPFAFSISMLDSNGVPNASDCAISISASDPMGLQVLTTEVDPGQLMEFDFRPTQILSATFRASTNGTFGVLFDAEPVSPGSQLREFNPNGTSTDGTCARRMPARLGFIRSRCPSCYQYEIQNTGSCTLRFLYQEVERVGTGNQWRDVNPFGEGELAPGGSLTIGPIRIRQLAIYCETLGPSDVAPCKIRATATRLADNQCP